VGKSLKLGSFVSSPQFCPNQVIIAAPREGSAERYKIKFECRSLKSYALLMPSPKA